MLRGALHACLLEGFDENFIKLFKLLSWKNQILRGNNSILIIFHKKSKISIPFLLTYMLWGAFHCSAVVFLFWIKFIILFLFDFYYKKMLYFNPYYYFVLVGFQVYVWIYDPIHPKTFVIGFFMCKYHNIVYVTLTTTLNDIKIILLLFQQCIS